MTSQAPLLEAANQEWTVFRLRAIILHQGDKHSGHYIVAVGRPTSSDMKELSWYLCDDSKANGLIIPKKGGELVNDASSMLQKEYDNGFSPQVVRA